MKKIKFYLVAFFCAFVMMSFTLSKMHNTDTDFIKIEIPLDNIDIPSGWGAWSTTGCLKGLDFRVRNDSYNKYAKKYKWYIQFRNRYRENIHLSFKAVAPSERNEIKRTEKTTDRIHVDGNSGTYKTYYLVNSRSSVYVYVNKIRIGAKDYGYDYYNCDK
ncbi:hypothetical protein [Polaribacter sp. IC073]|uniref:hypothetical protein n=1 Tax=Polaribacter sp. IC073 TaxID=2508540 RepID=UPI0011BD6D5B|nr:hypothetical protein [Polaribacter sp. IC073]TXD48392.1 hypothetical protein ES045_08180 [Polaribacter sp. IC073]